MTSSRLMWSKLTVRPSRWTMATAVWSIRCSVSWSDSLRPRRARPVGACAKPVISHRLRGLHLQDLRLYVSSLEFEILPPRIPEVRRQGRLASSEEDEMSSWPYGEDRL